MHPFFVSFLIIIGASETIAADSPKVVFEKRILPIFKSPNPSSCTECHLVNLDIKNYILSTSEKTFLSMRDQGLVDMKEPEKSRILKFISMKDTNSKPNIILAKT
ncbi:MAG: hypothetical protein RL553_1958, partial [Planctomycetota bacterium]